MKIYYDGEIENGGFRFLRDTICIDFVEENQPIDEYLTAITNYINEEKITKLFVYSPSREKIDITFLSRIAYVEKLSITAYCQISRPSMHCNHRCFPLQIKAILSISTD